MNVEREREKKKIKREVSGFRWYGGRCSRLLLGSSGPPGGLWRSSGSPIQAAVVGL